MITSRPRDADHLRPLERAHLAYLTSGEHERAVRAAFWLGLRLLFRGEAASANGSAGPSACCTASTTLSSVFAGVGADAAHIVEHLAKQRG